jgi:uncharacterized protein DUF3168
MSLVQSIAAVFGFLPVAGGSLTIALNAATNLVGFSFVAQANTFLKATRFRASNVAGTGGTITCQVFADVGGAPGGPALDTLTVGPLLVNTWVAAAAGTFVLTRGNRYWVVYANIDAAPGTNFTTVLFGAGTTMPLQTADDCASSTDSGGTWVNRAYSWGARFDFGDGTYLGAPTNGAANLALPTNAVYSANEAGTVFTTPPNGEMVIAGVAGLGGGVSGTPTGNLFYKLYDANRNLLAATFPISNGEARASSTNWKHRLFDPSTVAGGAATITLIPSTTYTVTLAESANADSSVNSFHTFGATWDSDPNSLGLIPWSMQGAFFNGGVWSQVPGLVMAFGLILQTGGEFAAQPNATPPMPTLTITDHGDGTGATATISGSTAGSTNTVDVVGLASNGSLNWTNGGSRAGDGTVALALADGHYLAVAVSTLSALDSAPSNAYEFSVTGGATQPSIRAALYAYLSAQPGITALVGSSPPRICPVKLPQKVARPALIYRKVKGGHAHNVSPGSAGRAMARFRLDCLADDYQDCDLLAEAVRQAMDVALNKTAAGVAILSTSLADDADEEDDFFEPIDGSDGGVFGVTLHYDVVYLESVASP